MAPPQLLSDFMRLMLLLAPSAAIICLVLAGLSLRQGSIPDALIGSNFAKWMFWAWVVFLMLPQLISWFPSFGVPAPLPGGGVGTGWMANLQTDVASLRAELRDEQAGTHVRGIFRTASYSLTVQGGHPASLDSRCDVLARDSNDCQPDSELQQRHFLRHGRTRRKDSLWNYTAGTICPIAAGLAIIGAIWNFVGRRPVMPLVGATLGLLTVSAIWKTRHIDDVGA